MGGQLFQITSYSAVGVCQQVSGSFCFVDSDLFREIECGLLEMDLAPKGIVVIISSLFGGSEVHL